VAEPKHHAMCWYEVETGWHCYRECAVLKSQSVLWGVK
jgi:hypothetical protein